ncbi:MAG TPA: dihydrolipoamide acetyltransferase family protein [Actinomycetota bacterium]|nr:dihydrolipoamide acetyltransferase family protein [Actinomycetota bacterium]
MAERIFALPDLGEGLEEAEVGEWLVAEGDEVALNQPLAEVETAKAVVEIPSPVAGRVVRLHAQAGATVKVGDPLVTFEVAGAPPVAGPAGDPSSGSVPASAYPSPAGVAATPAVRRLAKDLGVDLSSVRGSGPGGRVTPADVERAAARRTRGASEPTAYEALPISMVRRTIAENLTRVVREVPQVTTFRTLDCSALEALRGELGVSPLPVVVRALAEVCTAHRLLNASYLPDEGEIRLHLAVNVGIATDTERGLVVPVVRDVGALGIREVAAEIRRLATLAREARLAPADMAGGTITVTNTGSYGSEFGTPILTPGQGAILALGAIEQRALVVGGMVTARPACTLSLTFDHRLLDGATAGRAFGDLVALLESPERLEGLPR